MDFPIHCSFGCTPLILGIVCSISFFMNLFIYSFINLTDYTHTKSGLSTVSSPGIPLMYQTDKCPVFKMTQFLVSVYLRMKYSLNNNK